MNMASIACCCLINAMYSRQARHPFILSLILMRSKMNKNDLL
jgi:hypothetical protein